MSAKSDSCTRAGIKKRIRKPARKPPINPMRAEPF
jgi:hypothetical protein